MLPAEHVVADLAQERHLDVMVVWDPLPKEEVWRGGIYKCTGVVLRSEER